MSAAPVPAAHDGGGDDVLALPSSAYWIWAMMPCHDHNLGSEAHQSWQPMTLAMSVRYG